MIANGEKFRGVARLHYQALPLTCRRKAENFRHHVGACGYVTHQLYRKSRHA